MKPIKRKTFLNNELWELPNGYLHREDGPAIKNLYGDKIYYYNNKLHREDGPAVEYHDGDKEWWLHNNQYSEQEYKKIQRNKKINQILK